MLLLPAEVIVHILAFVPLSSYPSLYQVFPQELLDEALKSKVRQQPQVIELVSTNLHELVANETLSSSKLRNESSVPLQYIGFDTLNQVLWFTPDSPNQFFKVKHGFVSHGKLIVRANKKSLHKVIMSLWDVRKKLPPKRSGSLSGASQVDCSEYTEEVVVWNRDFILDGYISTCKAQGQLKRTPLYSKLAGLIPPPLPSSYSRKMPSVTQITARSRWEPQLPNPTCGLFIVEHIALSVPAFLELFL
ncbi:hypothetical protein NQZ79_g4885 [Umbelopsis isabellina]|nr:hypothetical protein NQZ79_g4885 [Umbelopsis isabellina]